MNAAKQKLHEAKIIRTADLTPRQAKEKAKKNCVSQRVLAGFPDNLASRLMRSFRWSSFRKEEATERKCIVICRPEKKRTQSGNA
jgi:hypothetical protein